jgi:peptide/nickel transport system permease protein
MDKQRLLRNGPSRMDEWMSTSSTVATPSWIGTALRIASARPSFAAGYIIVFVAVLAGALAPLVAPYNPIEADPSQFLQPPNRLHWLGTDAVGMDIFSRVLYGPRIDITIAVLGTMVSATVGCLVGAWVGYFSRAGNFRSRIAFLIMRVADVLQAFPVFVFAIALVASLGQSIQTVVFAIAFVNIPIYLRLMRSQVMAIREMRYVEASLVAGMSDMQTILRHVIPNAMGPALAQLSVNVGWSILLTAGLSFVGAGVRAPSPEWGSMIATGFQNVVTGEWWPSVFPGLALAITVFGFSLVGNSVEVFGDPVKIRRLIRDVTLRERTRAARRRA